MIKDWIKFNEDLTVSDSQYKTNIKRNRIYINSDNELYDMSFDENCIVYWSIDIQEDEEGLINIKPIINKIELSFNCRIFKNENDEDDYYEKKFNFTIPKNKIKIDNSYENKFSFKFKPRSIDIDLDIDNNKIIKSEVDFYKSNDDDDEE
jgi:hypothetical protein